MYHVITYAMLQFFLAVPDLDNLNAILLIVVTYYA